MIRSCVLLVLFCCSVNVHAQNLRWSLVKDGSIEWRVKKNAPPHTDQIEMSGKQVSLILTYGIDSLNQLVIKKKVVFPMLRIFPNDTHGSLIKDYDDAGFSILINGQPTNEKPVAFSFNGMISIRTADNDITTEREIFPATDKAAVIEKRTIINNSKQAAAVTIPAFNVSDTTDKAKSVYGPYVLSRKVYGAGKVTLAPGEQYTYAVIISGSKITDPPYAFSAGFESVKRMELVKGLTTGLVLKTPNDTLNRMFAFAKIRAAESIFDTRNGLMHGPGGGAYYAAIWANDQAEYVDPFFPFLGNAAGNESAMNSFRLFAKYINPEYKPLPSSIVAEGLDIWDGAGDRGDQAMIAYGAARFALAYADTAEARKLWPLINWSLEFLRRKMSKEGVIASDADELEGRFPTGKINLSTNVLAYGAMVSASHLAIALGDETASVKLYQESVILRAAIEKYFGAKVQGYDTYRYYKGNTTLRSWIGLPLVMGMFERKDQTLKALFSSYLWTKDGMLSESGSKTFWDRSLLYALRGSFYAGATDSTLKYLKYYSSNRLLGEHVPYAIEAWPEGNQRHLSAESGLYCRLVTEGLFGIQPTGFNTFTLQPSLPSGWNEMALEHIKAFKNDFNIKVTRAGKTVTIIITQDNGKTQEYAFDNKTAVKVIL